MKRFALLTMMMLLVPVVASSGPSQQYNDLTNAERYLLLRYFWQAPTVYRASTHARDESSSRYSQLSGQDDQRDAYRHSLFNGSMTRRLTSKRSAKRWGDAHEEFPANPAVRKAMDLANNDTGREITWNARSTSGPWWWRRTRFPSDAQIGTTLRGMLGQGQLVMIEEVGGQRDPHGGALVSTTTP